MSGETARVERLHLLDAMRGLAAVAVVFWHWQHFRSTGGGAGASVDSPLRGMFFAFYDYGWVSVDLFFAISGFVFFWLYRENIAQRRTSGVDFFVLRFSRLYPLHFLTLSFMAIGQLVRQSIGMAPFVYDANGLGQFVANLFFVQAWPVGAAESFDGPTWSVSIEVLLYLVFFWVARLCVTPRLRVFVIAVVVGIVLTRFHRTLGRGVSEFYLGGLAWYVWHRLDGHRHARTIAIVSLVAVAALWIGAFVEIGHRGIAAALSAFCRSASLPWFGSEERASVLLGFLFRVVVLPSTIFTLAQAERCRHFAFYVPLSALGDLTYSTYLLHVPLQLVLMTATGDDVSKLFGGDVRFMLLFWVALVVLSVASFRWIEMPLQKSIRRRFRDATSTRRRSTDSPPKTPE